MSAKALSVCWYMNLEFAEKLVLLAMADECGEEFCVPTMGNMRRKVGATEQFIREVIAQLEEMQIITRYEGEEVEGREAWVLPGCKG